MVSFLDTTIFICRATFLEKDFNKAVTIIQDGEWITTERVVNELRDVRKRRNEIYKKVLGYKFTPEVEFKDLYQKGFIYNCNKNNNDFHHVTNIFRYGLNECGFDWEDEITLETLEKFRGCIFSAIYSIKVAFGIIVSNFENPAYCQQYVMPKISPTTKCKELQKHFKRNLQNSISHKGDIKILMNAVLYGYYVHQGIIFRSTHGFFNGDPNKNIIPEAIKQFYPDHPGFEIKSLDDIVIQATLTNF